MEGFLCMVQGLIDQCDPTDPKGSNVQDPKDGNGKRSDEQQSWSPPRLSPPSSHVSRGSKSLQVSRAGMQTGVERHEYPAGAGVGESYLSCAWSPHSQSSHKGRSWCSPRPGKGSKPRTQGPSTQASPTSRQHSCAMNGRGFAEWLGVAEVWKDCVTWPFPPHNCFSQVIQTRGWVFPSPRTMGILPSFLSQRHASQALLSDFLSEVCPQRQTKHKFSLQRAPCYIHSYPQQRTHHLFYSGKICIA